MKGVPKSEFLEVKQGDKSKGGGEEGKEGKRWARAWRGERGGEEWWKKGGRKGGPKAHSKNPDFGIPRL